MKITKVLSKLITEDAKFQYLNKKYILPSGDRKKGLLPFEIVKQIVFADPTTRVPQNFDKEGASINDMLGEKIKAGKYSEWMIRLFLKPYLTREGSNEPIEVGSDEYKSKVNEYRRLFLEDLSQFTELLTKYERFKGSLEDASKKDINNVKSLNDLSHLKVKVGDETVDLNMYRGKKIKKEAGAAVNTNFNIPGAEILKVGSEYTLLKIADKGDLGSKAASYFGGYNGGLDRGETNWCTAAEGSSYSHTYRQQGPLYIFIANDGKGKVGEVTGLPSERYQFHFPSNQFKFANQHGGNIPVVEYLNGKWSEFKEIFKPEFAAGFVKPNSDNVEIKYPDSATGKFVALYGFDELFTSLPDTIKKLSIINTSDENVTIDVPNTIGRFKSLTAILFENMISNLPDSICELKNLVFIAAPNNKELRTIPECIMSLPNLNFVNVSRCPNIQVPKGLQQYDAGDGFYHLEE
jgi:hypothetical protein